MINIPSNLLGVKLQSHHRYAKLWKITRVDGQKYFFTSHDTNIVHEGDTYTPVNGVTGSAYEEEGSLEPADRQFDGVFNSGAIEREDMVLGKFSQATVTEYMVDWRYPWSGSFYEQPFWVVRLAFSDNEWRAEIVSTLDKLKDEVGAVYLSDCPHKFCDAGCGLSESSYDYSADPTSYDIVSEQRLKVKFTSSEVPGLDEGDLEHGYIEGSDIENTGFKREVKSHTVETDSPYYHIVELYFPMPEKMTSATGHPYTLHEGCNKDLDECETRFSNSTNHGGWFLCPGNDAVTEMPDAES